MAAAKNPESTPEQESTPIADEAAAAVGQSPATTEVELTEDQKAAMQPPGPVELTQVEADAYANVPTYEDASGVTRIAGPPDTSWEPAPTEATDAEKEAAEARNAPASDDTTTTTTEGEPANG